MKTRIEWADYTLNFWWGCTKVSAACAHCYAETMARRLSGGRATWGASGARWDRFDSAMRKLPKIMRAAARAGVRPRVFVNSMSDTFEDHPALPGPRECMLRQFEANPGVDFLLLTKRPENVLRMVPEDWLGWRWPAHVWIGTTVEDQAAADARVPELLKVPAQVRFLSCEPLLGTVDLFRGSYYEHGGRSLLGRRALQWVIVGGESGQSARPMHPHWARSLCRQCDAAGVPFFFKQWGEWCTNDQLPPAAEYDEGVAFRSIGCKTTWRVGKKAAGRLLDGREHNAVPKL